MQEEVCSVPAPPVCLLPVCSYARLTAYFGILPTRLPILPERDLTPSSSARGATLAVLASSVSRILPGQEYSIVTAIAAGVAYCNAPPLIPQGQKRKMFLTAKIFLKLFFDTEKATRLFTVGWWCIMFGWISRKLLFIMTCFENNQISKLNSTLNQKPVRRTL